MLESDCTFQNWRYRTNASTYRPISQFLFCQQWLKYWKNSFILNSVTFWIQISSKQFGFRPKLSTVSALTSFADEVLLHMESEELCGTVFLDLTKAFDTVNQDILLSKLSVIDVSLRTLQWFKSYQSHRKQWNSCDAMSDLLRMILGVLQGRYFVTASLPGLY